MNDPIDHDLPERLGRTYGSKEALKEKIRAMEARVVRSTRAIIEAGAHPQEFELLRALEMDLEWFLTWRLKLADTSRVMWCDGVIDLALHVRRDLSYEINARAYIGPESDATTTLCDLDGTMVLDDIVDPLKGYRLNITSEDEAFAITDAI